MPIIPAQRVLGSQIFHRGTHVADEVRIPSLQVELAQPCLDLIGNLVRQPHVLEDLKVFVQPPKRVRLPFGAFVECLAQPAGELRREKVGRGDDFAMLRPIVPDPSVGKVMRCVVVAGAGG